MTSNESDRTRPLLDVEGLCMHFPVQRGLLRRTVSHIRAVDGVSFAVNEGETFGIVGESGCGKTTTGRCITRILTPSGGRIDYRGRDGEILDLATLPVAELKRVRRDIRMIFQDPFSSLNPRRKVLDIIGQSVSAQGIATGKAREEIVAEVLTQAGLRPEYVRRYPHTFSGGERQRIGIARAIATKPRLIVADEAVSALDVSVQAQILNLMNDLKTRLNLTYIFIAHDLSVVEYICDRIAVMYLGRVVELADRDALFATPRHPYTEALMSAVPLADPGLARTRPRIRLEGGVGDPENPPPGCPFHPRCRYAIDRCRTEVPALERIAPGQIAACHRARELSLAGAIDAIGAASENSIERRHCP